MSSVRILIGDVREQLRALPDDHFDCVVTSPPYWGLRDYGTATWEGGDPKCDHRSPTMREGRNERRAALAGSTATNSAQLLLAHRSACGKCGAIKMDHQIGLEPTLGQHLDVMVDVFEEAMRHREAKEAAETKLKSFEGIEDPAKAREALATVANLDQKKLVDAGEIQKVKDEAIKAVRAEFEPIVAERDKLAGQLDKEIRGGAFLRSKFAEEKVAVPRHMLERTYGDNFKVEEGKLVPYDASGNKIFSRIKPGEVADFDEALELLITADPYKDHILKGTGAAGGGAANGGGGQGGAKTLNRGEFEKLAPADQMAKMRDGFTLVD